MLEAVWLIPALPLLGCVVLLLAGGHISRASTTVIGVGSVGLSAGAALLTLVEFVTNPPLDRFVIQTIWTWMETQDFSTSIGLRLDALSMVMVLVVTIVGFLIHLYSAEYMREEDGYARFFAYMNLFVASMLVLVLSDNLVFLYLGWEGVGLCSYLLIGFWYKDPGNVNAATKAFIVTRIGDTAMAIGLFLIFSHLGTLDIHELNQRAAVQWSVGSSVAVLASALLLGGAVGKSAQLPLQTWLPDAMAGPTPVSALIHAATMVTAGVYLIARMNGIFSLAPGIQFLVGVIGTLTLVIAGLSAMVQSDIKRALAYSTISQIGYMFLALGVGAWSAAIFHFASHACFKSLLFLGAGSVMICHNHERDMFKLGGLRRGMPVTFWTFLVGAASLAALPVVTAGFYSKDMILWFAWTSQSGSKWLWAGGLIGAFVTSIYAFRMVFLTFFGEARSRTRRAIGPVIVIPLVVLAAFSIGIGFLQTPPMLGNVQIFSEFVGAVLPPVEVGPVNHTAESVLELVAMGACLLGIIVACLLYVRWRDVAEALGTHSLGRMAHRLLFSGWGFDWAYERLFMRPFLDVTTWNRHDVVEMVSRAVAQVVQAFHTALSFSQTGRVRHYLMGLTVGAVLVAAMVVWL